jgi:hypothetical protein
MIGPLFFITSVCEQNLFTPPPQERNPCDACDLGSVSASLLLRLLGFVLAMAILLFQVPSNLLSIWALR